MSWGGVSQISRTMSVFSYWPVVSIFSMKVVIMKASGVWNFNLYLVDSHG